MSFSFQKQASTKAALLVAVAAAMAQVVEAQPVHALDEAAVNAGVDAYLRLLPEQSERDYLASVSGSVSWEGDTNAEAVTYTGASVSVHVALAARKEIEPIPVGTEEA